MSQSDLGNLIGLNSNRVQQYENGARKPKLDLAKKIAAALEVETSAILDPQVSSYVGAMYAFFEMEELYGLRLEEVDNQIHIVFGDKYNRNIINEHLEAWYNRKQILEKELAAATTDKEKKALIREYHMWEWTFPRPLANRTEKVMQKKRLEDAANELLKQATALDEELNSGK